MFQKILAAYDGSEPAMTAFNHALDLTRKYQGELHVLSIVRPPDIAKEVETEAIMENSVRHYQEIQTPLKAIAETQGGNIRFVVAIGHPAVKITSYAEENGIDLILCLAREKLSGLIAPSGRTATLQIACVRVTTRRNLRLALHPAGNNPIRTISPAQGIMGHRGKTFFERWLIGSVAKKVMSYASCSVLVVR